MFDTHSGFKELLCFFSYMNDCCFCCPQNTKWNNLNITEECKHLLSTLLWLNKIKWSSNDLRIIWYMSEFFGRRHVQISKINYTIWQLFSAVMFLWFQIRTTPWILFQILNLPWKDKTCISSQHFYYVFF